MNLVAGYSGLLHQFLVDYNEQRFSHVLNVLILYQLSVGEKFTKNNCVILSLVFFFIIRRFNPGE